jgi:hypothetical protein
MLTPLANLSDFVEYRDGGTACQSIRSYQRTPKCHRSEHLIGHHPMKHLSLWDNLLEKQQYLESTMDPKTSSLSQSEIRDSATLLLSVRRIC